MKDRKKNGELSGLVKLLSDVESPQSVTVIPAHAKKEGVRARAGEKEEEEQEERRWQEEGEKFEESLFKNKEADFLVVSRVC